MKLLTDETSARVRLGREQAAQARVRMGDALQAVIAVATVLGQIKSAAAEQQLGLSQVNAAVNDIDGITQRNAAMVGRLSDSTQGLREQVKSVDSSMGLFSL